MIDGISSSGPATPSHVQRTRAQAVDQNQPAREAGPVPATPPAEVLSSLDTAAGVLAEMDAQKVGVHFGVSDGPDGPRLSVHVRNADGDVSEIAPGHLLDVLSGESRGFLVDLEG